MADNTNPQADIEQIRELLSPYLDGEVSEAERILVEQAVADSQELRQELDSLRKTVTLLNNLPSMPAPRPFTLAETDVKPVAPAPRKKFWLSGWLGGLAALTTVLICAVIAGTLFLGNFSGMDMAFPEVAQAPAGEPQEVKMAAETAPTETAPAGAEAPAGAGVAEEAAPPPETAEGDAPAEITADEAVEAEEEAMAEVEAVEEPAEEAEALMAAPAGTPEPQEPAAAAVAEEEAVEATLPAREATSAEAAERTERSDLAQEAESAEMQTEESAAVDQSEVPPTPTPPSTPTVQATPQGEAEIASQATASPAPATVLPEPAASPIAETSAPPAWPGILAWVAAGAILALLAVVLILIIIGGKTGSRKS